MRQFKRKWTLDRQKFLSEAEVKKLRRVVEDKALADSTERPYHLAPVLDGRRFGGQRGVASFRNSRPESW